MAKCVGMAIILVLVGLGCTEETIAAPVLVLSTSTPSVGQGMMAVFNVNMTLSVTDRQDALPYPVFAWIAYDAETTPVQWGAEAAVTLSSESEAFATLVLPLPVVGTARILVALWNDWQFNGSRTVGTPLPTGLHYEQIHS